jgi:lysophospholipase L1-like esterase
MQIHNYGASQTLFAFNRWNANDASDIGIGNQPGGPTTNTDWTFAQTAGSFSVKSLQIVVGGAALPPPPPAIKIMPLGDSITDGVGAPGGYRLPLQGKLNAVGINPDFVGSQNDNSGGLSDPEHEGHSGFTIAGIKGLPITDRITTYQPDVTLLMIGTNDISGANAGSIPSLLAQLDDLISTIEGITLTNGLHTKLIVAQIVPREGDNTLTQMYNDGIPALIAAHQALGQPVSMVDMFHALNPDSSDFADTLHPNASGYDKMATVWTAGIQAAVPEPTTPLLLGVIGFFFGTARRRRAIA